MRTVSASDPTNKKSPEGWNETELMGCESYVGFFCSTVVKWGEKGQVFVMNTVDLCIFFFRLSVNVSYLEIAEGSLDRGSRKIIKFDNCIGTCCQYQTIGMKVDICHGLQVRSEKTKERRASCQLTSFVSSSPSRIAWYLFSRHSAIRSLVFSKEDSQ